ncbi:zinc-binding dehydrogenase [Devosia sp.]|uniref:zinc-binding dehydrogenase n=1 Tax=Devosia sp. TaxID=1871048 RepID=UPI003BA8CE85
MKSVVFEAFGAPGEVLKLAERPLPEPGPGQVRVKMGLAPIHNHDLAIIMGTYGYKPALPAVPGTEAMGVVDKLGDGVSHLSVGQRVAGGASATWAEYYLVDGKRLVPLPDTVSDETGCQLVSMPLSALMLLEDLDIKAGDWVIQNAANGAVGKVFAQLAPARGVNVVNLVRRDAGIAELAALGIGNAVSTETAGWQDRVKAITSGAPIIRAIDSVAGEAADQIMETIGQNGVLISFGAMSGKPLVISPANLLFKTATVKGFWGAKRSEQTSPAELGRMIGELVKLAGTGALKLEIEAAYDLSNAREAANASAVPGRKGKIALRGSR